MQIRVAKLFIERTVDRRSVQEKKCVRIIYTYVQFDSVQHPL